ncbi:MAG: serine/threonine-protein kinase, partial [Myxococcota bacterium]
MESGYQQFGPFRIVRTLGRGGMGEDFVARTPWSKNPIAAVKRLRPDVARVPTFAERFQHESELAVRLEHQNVVATIDVGSVEGQLYVASELVQGKDTGIIADRLRERGQGGPAAVAIRLMLDVLSGLAYVHDAVDLDGTPLALVHRDITPGNVLVGYDGVAKLADFGLAKSLLTEESHLTQHGEILGTPHYLAPEIIRGESASRLSDLYGLGAVMYRFLTGVAPHTGTTAEVLLKVLSEEPRSLSELRPDLSPWLVTFVHGLLTKQPAQRPEDARALVAQLHLEAKAAGLLVPRSAVGRWLSDLFEAEKVEELEERDRLIALKTEDFQDQAEGTVVLAARAQTDAPFQAPDPAETGVAADALSLGTDLSIDPNAEDNTDAQPAPGMLGEAAPWHAEQKEMPGELTEAGQAV